MVAATAVASVVGVAHLRSRDAADLGSPPVLNHGSTHATTGPNAGGHHGRSEGPGATHQQPGLHPDLLAPGDRTHELRPPVDRADRLHHGSHRLDHGSHRPTTGPTDSTTGPTDPSSTPGDPSSTPTGGPGGDPDLGFTSTPPADPTFGSTYRLRASGGSGKQIVFSIDPATTHRACSLDDAGTTVTFDHAGRCVIAAHADARSKVSTGAARSSTDAVQRIQVDMEDQDLTFHAPAGATVGGSDELTATSSSGLSVDFAVDPSSTNGACDVTGSNVSYDHALSCSVVASQPGNHDYRPAADVSRTFDIAKGTQTITFAGGLPDDAVVDGTPYAVDRHQQLRRPGDLRRSTTRPRPPTPAPLTGDSIAFHHHGTCAITATDRGQRRLPRPPPETSSFAVDKGTRPSPSPSTPPPTPRRRHAVRRHRHQQHRRPGRPSPSTTRPPPTPVPSPPTTVVPPPPRHLRHHRHRPPAAATTCAATGDQSFDVGKGTQTVTFAIDAARRRRRRRHAYPVTATSSSGDPVDLQRRRRHHRQRLRPHRHRPRRLPPPRHLRHHRHRPPAATTTCAATGDQTFDVGRGTQTVSFTSSAPEQRRRRRHAVHRDRDQQLRRRRSPSTPTPRRRTAPAP